MEEYTDPKESEDDLEDFDGTDIQTDYPTEPLEFKKYWIEKFSRTTCCSTPLCAGHTYRPAVPPVCKCGRKCESCGRFKYILIRKLPDPPEGIMKTRDHINKLNWVDHDPGYQIALFPASFWNIWNQCKTELQADGYRVSKIGNTWVVIRKKIEYGIIKKRPE